MKSINKKNAGTIKKCLAFLMAFGVILSLSVLTVSAAAYPTNSVVIGVNRLLKSGSESDADRTALSTQAEGYPVPLFDMGTFAVIYPGESLTADLLITNDTPDEYNTTMTVRVTPEVEENDCILNEIIWLIAMDGTTELYNGIVPIFNGAAVVKDLAKFTVSQSRHITFAATVLGGADILDIPGFDPTGNKIDQYLAFSDRYMGQSANFQVVFTAQKIIIEPETTTTEEVTTTAPPPTTAPDTTVPLLTDGPGPGGGGDYILPGSPLAVVPPNIVDVAALPDIPPPLTNPPTEAASEPEPTITTAGEEVPTISEVVTEIETLEPITDATPPLTNAEGEPIETLKENPKTGETDPFGFVAAGMILMMCGSVMAVGARKSKKK